MANNKNGHWYTDKNGNHYFVENGQTPQEGWEASKRRKMINGGKYQVSEDGENWKDVDKKEYDEYESDDASFDENVDDDFGFDEDLERDREEIARLEYEAQDLANQLVEDGYFKEGEIKDIKFNDDEDGTIDITTDEGTKRYEYAGGRLYDHEENDDDDNYSSYRRAPSGMPPIDEWAKTLKDDDDDGATDINNRSMTKENLVYKLNDAHIYNADGKFQVIMGQGLDKEFDTKNEALDYLSKQTGKNYDWARDDETRVGSVGDGYGEYVDSNGRHKLRSESQEEYEARIKPEAEKFKKQLDDAGYQSKENEYGVEKKKKYKVVREGNKYAVLDTESGVYKSDFFEGPSAPYDAEDRMNELQRIDAGDGAKKYHFEESAAGEEPEDLDIEGIKSFVNANFEGEKTPERLDAFLKDAGLTDANERKDVVTQLFTKNDPYKKYQQSKQNPDEDGGKPTGTQGNQEKISRVKNLVDKGILSKEDWTRFMDGSLSDEELIKKILG